MKDGLPRPISQHISLQNAFSEGSPVLSSFTGTVPVLNESDDVLLWRWSANGEYSAYSVYKVLIEAGRINWGFVGTWRAAAPLKVQVFSQLLLKDKLPTREMLQRRGMSVEPHCVMCQDCSVETAKNLFFTCQNAKEVWSRFATFLQIGDAVRDTWEASCNFYCSSNRERNRHVWITYFMSVLWSLWRQRNEVIFRDKKLPSWLVAN
ncbi:uncharacterized protein LOC144563882 [Carex rostrata]